MQKILLFSIAIFSSACLMAQNNVGLGTTNPDPSAALEIKSTDQGLLIPRMDSTARNAILNPAQGLLVFDSTANAFWYYNGTAWQSLAGQDDQMLTLSNDTLYLENGGMVVLPSGTIDTDQQTLTLNGDTLSISNGNSVVLPGIITAQNDFALLDTCVLSDYQQNAAHTVYQGANDVTLASPNGWQSFTATSAGNLYQIDILIDGLETIAGGNIRIYAGEGTGGTLLYQAPVSLPNSGWNSVLLPFNTVGLTANAQYTIYLEDTLDYFSWYTELFTSYSGGRSNTDQDDDRLFRTYTGNCSTPYVISPNANGYTTNLGYIDTINFSNDHAFTGSSLKDHDLDTKVETEKTPDDDAIRFTIAGKERLVIKENSYGLTLISIPNNNANTFIGEGAGEESNDDAYTLNNTFIGYHAGKENIFGEGNSAIGAYALEKNLFGFDNNAFGVDALNNNSYGRDNIGIGRDAGKQNVDGSFNVLIGSSAGRGSGTSTHDKSNNVMIGHDAGKDNQGNANVFLGYKAGRNETGSNKLYRGVKLPTTRCTL